MHSFAYKNGTLYCENVNLQELADKESTPLYVYSKQTNFKPLSPPQGSSGTA